MLTFAKIDMSNIIDQAQKIIEANGFKDSANYSAMFYRHQ
jgi:hypothetical protein